MGTRTVGFAFKKLQREHKKAILQTVFSMSATATSAFSFILSTEVLVALSIFTSDFASLIRENVSAPSTRSTSSTP
jgi:hypothetical protein